MNEAISSLVSPQRPAIWRCLKSPHTLAVISRSSVSRIVSIEPAAGSHRHQLASQSIQSAQPVPARGRSIQWLAQSLRNMMWEHRFRSDDGCSDCFGYAAFADCADYSGCLSALRSVKKCERRRVLAVSCDAKCAFRPASHSQFTTIKSRENIDNNSYPVSVTSTLSISRAPSRSSARYAGGSTVMTIPAWRV